MVAFDFMNVALCTFSTALGHGWAARKKRSTGTASLHGHIGDTRSQTCWMGMVCSWRSDNKEFYGQRRQHDVGIRHSNLRHMPFLGRGRNRKFHSTMQTVFT